MGYNELTDISVTYATGAAGSGSLVLRATGAASDTGYYNVVSLGQGYPGVVLKNHNDTNRDRSGCLIAGAGEGAWQCGDLLVSHSLPGYTTMGRERSLTMVYTSAQAVPKPLVAASVTNGDISLPVNVYAELRVGTTGGTQTVRATGTFTGWNFDPSPRQIALTYDASADPTGAYPFTLVIQNQYPGTYSTTRTGTLLVINRSQSEFGAGWALAGVERLHFGQPVGTSNGDILWVGGDGSAKLYAKLNATTWVAPLGAYRDTIAYNAGTTEYTRTLRHKIQVVYDAMGRHVRTINRMEQPTYFYWNTSTGKLDSVVVPPTGQTGTRYALTYDGNGNIDSIADPGGRALNVTVTSGNTLAIRDPDLVTTTFTYAGTSGRMLTRTNRRGYRTRFEYANNLRLTKVHVPGGVTGADTSVTEFKPWDEKGLPGQAAVQDSAVYTKIFGPRLNVADDARFWVDKWGAPTKIVNAIGATTLLVRGDTTVPQLVTKVTFPNGRIGIMTYDARGNLLEGRDSTWHLGATARDSTRLTTYQYLDGNAPDSPSRVGDSYNRYSYYWYNSLGLTDSVKDTRNLVTVFAYTGSGAFQGLLNSVTEKGVTVWQESTSDTIVTDLVNSFTYHPLGNIKTATSPSGNVTAYVTDGYGRTAEIYDPLGGKSNYVYDALNRTVRSYQHTPVRTPPFTVTQSCQANQLLCADSTWPFSPALPDSLGSIYKLGAMTLDTVIDPRNVKRAFGYDAQGRQRIEQDEFGYQKIAFYDRAGLLDSILTRDSIKVRFKYDTIGRRTFMSFPQRASPFTSSGDQTVVLGDTVRYTYDIMGNVLTAQNRWNNAAPITRTYYATGALKTQRTSYDSLYFEYDRNGQRRRMIMNWGKDTVDYSYGTTGDLQTITARLDTMTTASTTRVFTFSWDKLGRRTKVVYPGSIVVTLAYDKNGSLRQVKSVNPATSPATDNLDFVWRNRDVDPVGRVLRQSVVCTQYNPDAAVEAPCGDGTTWTINRYNRLGMLVWQWADSTSATPADSFAYDASGNRLFRKEGSTGARTWFTMVANSNRLAYDSTGSTQRVVTQYHNKEGARILEWPSDNTQAAVAFYKGYYYDGLGRMSGSFYATWSGSDFFEHWSGNDCTYDADGQLVLPCDNGSPLLYFDGNNVVGNSHDWRFIQGPGVDDVLMAVKRDPAGAYSGYFRRLLFMVTDGTGRRYAVGAADGSLSTDDVQTSGLGAWRFSGAVTKSNTFGAARMENADLPTVSYFRNRSYDSRTGRWMQEDPIGLAGGMNLYQFNGNNPVAYTDPFGLCPPKMDPNSAKCYAWNQQQVHEAENIIAHQKALKNQHALGRGSIEPIGINASEMADRCPAADPRAGCTVLNKNTGISYHLINADRHPEAISGILVHERQHERTGALNEPCAVAREASYMYTMARKDPAAFRNYTGSPQSRQPATHTQKVKGCGF